MAGAMLVTAVLFAVYPMLQSAWAMGLCSVLLGLVLGTGQPMVMSLLHQITPSHRQGEALGLRLMAINASSVLMPLMFGSAGAVIGVSGLFWGWAPQAWAAPAWRGALGARKSSRGRGQADCRLPCGASRRRNAYSW